MAKLSYEFEFLLDFTGAQEPPTALQMTGCGDNNRDVRIVVGVTTFPEHNRRCTGTVKASTHKALFRPGSEV